MGRKHYGKRRNCSLRAISPFPIVFSKDLYCRHIKPRACMGKSLRAIFHYRPKIWSGHDRTGRTSSDGLAPCMLYITLTFPPYILILTHWRKKRLKNIVKKVKLLQMSNFFFYNVFYAICFLKSLNSHISVVVCILLEFGTVSKGCIRERDYSSNLENSGE